MANAKILRFRALLLRTPDETQRMKYRQSIAEEEARLRDESRKKRTYTWLIFRSTSILVASGTLQAVTRERARRLLRGFMAIYDGNRAELWQNTVRIEVIVTKDAPLSDAEWRIIAEWQEVARVMGKHHAQ